MVAPSAKVSSVGGQPRHPHRQQARARTLCGGWVLPRPCPRHGGTVGLCGVQSVLIVFGPRAHDILPQDGGLAARGGRPGHCHRRHMSVGQRQGQSPEAESGGVASKLTNQSFFRFERGEAGVDPMITYHHTQRFGDKFWHHSECCLGSRPSHGLLNCRCWVCEANLGRQQGFILRHLYVRN